MLRDEDNGIRARVTCASSQGTQGLNVDTLSWAQTYKGKRDGNGFSRETELNVRKDTSTSRPSCFPCKSTYDLSTPEQN